mmetsp:Transcript_26960/g.41473  ORF Transcript_26960/g.41473 Transcript_26960/m.41473 type:complete len:253 (+) Transcript_26960:55-813(+)
MTIEPKEHAVDTETHPADKASKWDIPLESDQWILSHNALRCEINSMIQALGTFMGRIDDDGVPQWAVNTIKEWWASHVAHVTNHCKSEETVYKPMFSERFKWPAEIDELHDALNSVKDKVQTAIDRLNAEKSNLVAVRDALSAYEETMLKHFEVEETTALPLMRAYFTPEEISPVQRKILEDAPENAMGALIFAMSPDGAKFRSDFMTVRSIPSFVWYLAFKGRLASYKKDVVAKVEAIESGKEPAKKSGWF